MLSTHQYGSEFYAGSLCQPPAEGVTRDPDPRGTSGDALLRELQANILQSHGRSHAVLIFLRFSPGERTGARRWLRQFAAERLTTAWQQAKLSCSTVVHIALSAEGYRALGVDSHRWPSPVERPDAPPGPDVFADGMRDRADQLDGNGLPQWDPAYSRGVHGMILAASDELSALICIEAQVVSETKGIATVTAIERAFELKQAGSAPSSVFGVREGEPRLRPCPVSDYTPADAMSQLLTPDPSGQPRLSYGSYLVFRKLEQNLRASYGANQKLAQRFGLGPESAIALANRPCGHASAPAVWHSMARRCVPYGGPVDTHGQQLPSRGHGLLFMSYQANIREQFEAMQKWWSRSRAACAGSSGSTEGVLHRTENPCAGFAEHVTVRGGEYLFSPSASFFRSLVD